MSNSKLKPYINIGPGSILKRNLESLGWSQEDLAQITDMSVKTISKIINNKQRITVETSKLLSKALGTSPEFWLNLDNNYRLRMLEESNSETSTQIKAEIRKYMPVLEIQKKGWSSIDNSAKGYQKAFREIWNVESFDSEVYEKELDYCARRSKDHEIYTKYYSLTWLQIAKNFADAIKAPKYKPDKLKKLYEKFTEYTKEFDGVVNIIKELHNIGVKFFVQSHLTKTYLDGACFMNKANPVIVYTARHDRVDNFWFTLAHEIAHVTLHLPKNRNECFLDDLDTKDLENLEDIEQEADLLAEKILKIEEVIKLSTPFLNYFSDHNLQSISRELKIEPSLVLGILQYRGYIDYRKLNKYKKKVSNLFPVEVMKG